MDELKAAMLEMPNDPEGLAGWLLSNYDLHPKGTVEPTQFHRKAKPAVASNDFFKRANADKLLNNPKYSAVLGAMQQLEQGEELEDVSEEEDDVSQYLARAKGAKKVSMAQMLANSSLTNTDEEMSEEELSKIQALVAGKEEPDVAGQHLLIQKQRIKKLQAQRNLIDTGAAGKIRRSE